ncbi:MAG TPA: nucleotide sugar dehydrogenase [Patescibacteria group bacterium]|nr:nucleotide sugar dehydrogenase [Patescibacteria group bacterium]
MTAQRASLQPVQPALDVDALCAKFVDRTAKIGIIGLGYVGLPLACATCAKDFQTVGFDIDEAKMKKLRGGESYIGTVPSDKLSGFVKSGLLTATSDFSKLAEVDAVILCVPTPLNKNREPDMTYVVKTVETVAKYLKRGQLVVLESTTYPGTTSDLVAPILEAASGLKSGVDFFLAFSPEREDPGNAKFHTAIIPKVVGGDGAAALRIAQTMYDQFLSKTVAVSSTATAEAVKLTENIFRSVNIALVNELKVIYDAMGIDIWEVIEAAKTKPFGYMPFYPGPGLGGHCIPIDPFYLTWKAREFGIATKFIELAGEINISMPRFVVNRLAEALDERFVKSLSASRILILGMAYKKNVSDIRESPSFTIMDLLAARRATIDFHDPHVDIVPPTREHAHYAGMASVSLSAEKIATYDAVVVVTDHDDVDYGMVAANAKLVIDTRNALHAVHNKANIVKA